MRKNKAFTLMELMIVIAIIMILSGAIVARIGTGSDKAKVAKAKAEMDEIVSACRAFYADTGYWPYWQEGPWANWNTPSPMFQEAGLISKDKMIKVIPPDGIVVNVTQTISDLWKGPYLDAVEWPVDPWGYFRYFVYYNPGTKLLWIFCAGPNKKWSGGADKDDLMLLVHQF